MYCVKCGVKLADSEKQCPLCQTLVFHPDITREEGEKLYPAARYPSYQVNHRSALVIVTTLFLMPLLISLLCDWRITGEITWSGYVAGALFVTYVSMVLPYWFRHPNPVIFVPCGFAAVGLFLLYINLTTDGNWFLSFAFPVVGGLCLIVTAVVTLLRYLPGGELYVFGGAFAVLGVFMLLVEFLMMITFDLSTFIAWSLYPLVALVLLGGMLIFLAISQPAREKMERKFFL